MTRFSFSACVQQTDLILGNVLNYGPHMGKRAGGINQHFSPTHSSIDYA